VELERKKMTKPIVIDLFAGAGGESSGIMQAFNEAGMDVELHAVNHWELALETHGLNHPEAYHYCEDVFKGTAKKHIRDKRIALLWASPECTHFSSARGGGPCNPQSRAGMNSVLEWCRDLTIDRVILENVKEILSYGELDDDGVPVLERKGKLFEEWWRNMESLGYALDKRILCAADYGAPTSRERLFIQAVRKQSGKTIMWPEPTHSRQNWVPAASVIDWSDLGVMLQDRKKPLCENTLRRIEHGIRKYWGELAEPYICILRGQSTTRGIHEPLPTLTTGQHLGLVVPVDNKSNRGGCLPVSMPVSTITTKQRHGVLQALVMGKHSNSKALPAGMSPLPTLSTESGPQMISPLIMGQHSGSRAHPADNSTVPTITTVPRVQIVNPLIMSYYGAGSCVDVESPVPTVTTKQRFGLVVPGQLALSYRMLSAAELAAATGFSKEYRFAGNKTETVKQIGNAVPPAFAYHQVRQYLESAA